MLISGLNIDMALPPYEEFAKAERQKRIEEELQDAERREILKLRMEEVICKMFSDKDLVEIQPYKEAIFIYLNNNGNFDIIYDISKLQSFVRIYYRILSKKNVALSEYILLQSLSRTPKNEVTEKIQRQFDEAKDILISAATKKCMEQGGTATDNDSINEIIDELIEQYKTGDLGETIFNQIYEKYKNKSEKVKAVICKILCIDSFEEIKSTCNSLANAISTIIYLKSNTDLNLNAHLISKRLELQRRKIV